MSQARNDDLDNRSTGGSSSQNLDRMIRQGRSFSGRERNCVFLNTLGKNSEDVPFANISAVSGLDWPDDGRALAQIDWDHDGDLDLWFSNRNAPRMRFMRNDTPATNRSIQLRLIGNGSDTNRNAVGARVTITLRESGERSQADQAQTADPPVRLVKTLRAGEGFLAQSSHWLHFGLGSSAEIQSVVVRWPDKNTTSEDFGPLAANGRYVLTQSTGQPRAIDASPRDLKIEPSSLTMPASKTTRRIPLVYRVPGPRLGFIDFDGQPHPFQSGPQQTTLVNLWSSSCRPCLKELGDFADRYDELKRAGVRILALSIDGLESDDQAVAAAASLAERLKLPFEVGLAPPLVIDELRRLNNLVIRMERPLVLPTSFLIDRQGRIDVIYKGPVDVDVLLADAQEKSYSDLEMVQRAAAFDGTVIDHAVINSPMAAAAINFAVARELLAMGKANQAQQEYLQALKNAPESALLLNDIGVLLMQQQEVVEAGKYFAKAVELSPEDPSMRINLARVLVSQGSFDSARDQLEQAIVAAPEHADAHFNLGSLLLLSKDPVAAQSAFERAIGFDANHAGAHFSLGNLYFSKGDFGRAKMHYQSALQAAPQEAAILSSLGKTLLREGNYIEAEKLFRSAIENRPGFADTHYQLGLVLVRLQNNFEARQQFQTALSLDPRHAGARTALSKLSSGQ